MAEGIVLFVMNIIIVVGGIMMGYGLFGHKVPVSASGYEIVFTVRPPVDLDGTPQSEHLGGFSTEAAAQQACLDLRTRLEREGKILQECRVSPTVTASDPPLDGARDE